MAVFSQWPAVHPEDSGVYICQAENSEGITEIKVELFVEGGPGAPVASVSTTDMTVVEGHTVTMVCQASGKVSASRFCRHLRYFPCHLLCFVLVFFQAPLLLPSPGPNSGPRCHGNIQLTMEP